MKKILYIALFVLAIIELNAHGACLVDQLKMQKACTGGAAPLQPPESEQTYQTQETAKQNYANQKRKLGMPSRHNSSSCTNGSCNINSGR